MFGLCYEQPLCQQVCYVNCGQDTDAFTDITEAEAWTGSPWQPKSSPSTAADTAPDGSSRSGRSRGSIGGRGGAGGDIVFFHDPKHDEVTLFSSAVVAMPAGDEPMESPTSSTVEVTPPRIALARAAEEVRMDLKGLPFAGDWRDAVSSTHCSSSAADANPSFALDEDLTSRTKEASNPVVTSLPGSPSRSQCGESSCMHVQSDITGLSDDAALLTSRDDRNSRVMKLRKFLAASGFRGVNATKRTGVVSKSFLYPLHAAVRANDVEAIHALLWAGGDRTKVDSNLLSPLQLAQKLNRQGSHDEAIRILAHSMPLSRSLSKVPTPVRIRPARGTPSVASASTTLSLPGKALSVAPSSVGRSEGER